MTVQQGAASLGTAGAMAAPIGALDSSNAALAAGASLSAQNPPTVGSFSFPTGSNSGPRQKQWSGLGLGGVGDYLVSVDAANASVQVEGTFGANGVCQIEGSLVGQNVEVLKDQSGNALRITARGIYQIGSLPAQFRPDVTAGDGTTNLTVTAIVRPTI